MEMLVFIGVAVAVFAVSFFIGFMACWTADDDCTFGFIVSWIMTAIALIFLIMCNLDASGLIP